MSKYACSVFTSIPSIVISTLSKVFSDYWCAVHVLRLHGWHAPSAGAILCSLDASAFERALNATCEVACTHAGIACQACSNLLSSTPLPPLPISLVGPCNIPSSEWELNGMHVQYGKRIAVGGFAEVFAGKYLGTLVAIKKLLATDPGAPRRGYGFAMDWQGCKGLKRGGTE
eukprot:scaffold181808_cov19-Tisochrysis_lutea.AAC.1